MTVEAFDAEVRVNPTIEETPATESEKFAQDPVTLNLGTDRTSRAEPGQRLLSPSRIRAALSETRRRRQPPSNLPPRVRRHRSDYCRLTGEHWTVRDARDRSERGGGAAGAGEDRYSHRLGRAGDRRGHRIWCRLARCPTAELIRDCSAGCDAGPPPASAIEGFRRGGSVRTPPSRVGPELEVVLTALA